VDGEDRYFGMPWTVGMIGLMYNDDVLKGTFGDNYTLPRTSQELIDMSETLKTSGKTAITYPGMLDQMTYALLYPWWAQYEGWDSYQKFYTGHVYDDISENYILSKDVYNQQGRLEALTELAKILDADAGYHNNNVNDYNENNFRNLQVQFLTAKENIAFYPCGDWLEEESGYEGASKFGMMKTPVISSIVKQLSTVKTDAELREVIDYVDGKTTEIDSKYSAQDIERVKDARNMHFANGDLQYAYVPAYSNAKALVKDFFLFMASDEGIKIYKENVAGGFVPFEYDYSQLELSHLERDVASIISKARYINFTDETLIVAGLKPFNITNGNVETMMGAKKSSAIYRSAQDVYNNSKISDSEWTFILQTAGLY
jgi:ABC-type glycerol-3-phosphate transport system substrate-binding protein